MSRKKPVLKPEMRELSAIKDSTQKVNANGCYEFVFDYGEYCRDPISKKVILSSRGLPADRNFIGELFRLVGYLYNHYELSREYFDLLDCAAQNLERCYGGEIRRFSADVGKTQEVRAKMAEYLNKVALIFDIAANRLDATMEGGLALKATYELKAQIYSEKADDALVLGMAKTETKSRTAKMLDLYQKAASEFSPYDFFRKPFLEMVDVYQKKLEEETTSAFDVTDNETAKLLAAASVPRVVSDSALTKFWRSLPGCGRRRPQSAPARPEAAPESKIEDDEATGSLRRRHG